MEIELPQLHAGQIEIWNDPARFKVVCCGRRWGKTHLGVLLCVWHALKFGKRAWWVAPSFPVAGIGWRLLKWLCVPIPGIDIKEVERMITFPGGGVVQVKSADNPDSLRGEGLDVLVMDEAADVKPEAWYEALRPTLAERRGIAMFIGTPRGMDNWFYDLFVKASEDGVVWKAWQSPTITNPYVPPEEIEAAREDMGPILFAQEFLAEFVVGGGTVFRSEFLRYYSWVGPYDTNGYERGKQSILLSHDGAVVEACALDKCVRFTTIDLAISMKQEADYTVLATWAATPARRIALIDVYRSRMTAPDVLLKMHEIQKKWHLSFLTVEKVAYQTSMAQFGIQQNLPIREVPPDRDKLARAMFAATKMQNGKVWFPEVRRSWKEDYIMEVLRFPQAKHDDCVDTLAVACEQQSKFPGSVQLASW